MLGSITGQHKVHRPLCWVTFWLLVWTPVRHQSGWMCCLVFMGRSQKWSQMLPCLVFLCLVSSFSTAALSDECSFCPSFPILQLGAPSNPCISMLLCLQLVSVVLPTVVLVLSACGLPVSNSKRIPLWTWPCGSLSLRLVFEPHDHLPRAFGGTSCSSWVGLPGTLGQLKFQFVKIFPGPSFQLDSDEQIFKNSLICGRRVLGIWAVKGEAPYNLSEVP